VRAPSVTAGTQTIHNTYTAVVASAKLTSHIQTEQDHTEQQIARFNAGSQRSVCSKNKYIQVTRRLTALLPTYGNKPCTCAVAERSCTQHRTLVSGGREPFILLDDISEQFNDFIVYVCMCVCVWLRVGLLLELSAFVAAHLTCAFLSMNQNMHTPVVPGPQIFQLWGPLCPDRGQISARCHRRRIGEA